MSEDNCDYYCSQVILVKNHIVETEALPIHEQEPSLTQFKVLLEHWESEAVRCEYQLLQATIDEALRTEEEDRLEEDANWDQYVMFGIT